MGKTTLKVLFISQLRHSCSVFFFSRMDLSRAHTSAKAQQSALALTPTVDTSHGYMADCFLHAVFPEKL